MGASVPNVRDAVFFYAERNDEQIRQPVVASVKAVHPNDITQHWGNRLDLYVPAFGEILENIPYIGDTAGMTTDPACWDWPPDES